MKATRTTPTRQAASLPDPLTPCIPVSLFSFRALSTLCLLPRTSLRTTNHEPRTLISTLVISRRNHVVSRRFRVVFGRFWSFQVGIFTDKNLRKPHFQPNLALLPLIFNFSLVPDRTKRYASQLNQPGKAALNFAILSLIFTLPFNGRYSVSSSGHGSGAGAALWSRKAWRISAAARASRRFFFFRRVSSISTIFFSAEKLLSRSSK